MIHSEYYLDPGGFCDKIFIGPHSESFNCTICLQVMKDSVRCGNDHHCCRSCMTTHIAANGSRCPTCRTGLPSNLKSVNVINNLIGELSVRCHTAKDTPPIAEQPAPKKKRGNASNNASSTASLSCSWTGQLKDLEDHMQSCGFVIVKCRFEECNIRMLRRQLGNHEAICENRLVRCDLCHDDMKLPQLVDHQAVCPYRSIACPNECGEQFPLNSLETHRSTCPLEPVDCPWKALVGCEHRGPRRDMPAHSADAGCHFTGITRKLQELSDKNKELSDEIKTVVANPVFASSDMVMLPKACFEDYVDSRSRAEIHNMLMATNMVRDQHYLSYLANVNQGISNCNGNSDALNVMRDLFSSIPRPT